MAARTRNSAARTVRSWDAESHLRTPPVTCIGHETQLSSVATVLSELVPRGSSLAIHAASMDIPRREPGPRAIGTSCAVAMSVALAQLRRAAPPGQHTYDSLEPCRLRR